MMAMISLWLKKVILVVLFAVFLDLLLPNGTMQRYIKMVMGFVIIVTMLSPITALLSKSFTWETIEFPLSKTGTQNMSLQQIQEQGNAIQEQQRKRIEEEWVKKIQSTIKEQVETQYPVTVMDVSVTTAQKRDSQGSMPEIRGVKLTLQANQKEPSVSVVKPVEPVLIDPNQTIHQEKENIWTAEMVEWNRQITAEISSHLQIPQTSIEIRWGGT